MQKRVRRRETKRTESLGSTGTKKEGCIVFEKARGEQEAHYNGLQGE